jgi:hypothetical protein
MIEYRDYQKDIIERGTKILKTSNLLYLAMEVRTGKTLTSLGICESLDVGHVLFLTKKKAMSSISSDYDLLCPNSFSIWIINYESMHKLPDIKWDVIIVDEAHSLGAFAKPNKRAKQVKEMVQKYRSKVILLSGTPTPESYSQMYHQVYGIPNNPFSKYANFYKFAKDYVNVRQRKINSMMINDYSDGKASIIDDMKPYTISFTQKQAGFVVKTTEDILEVDMQGSTYKMIAGLTKHRVIEGKDEVVLADTPVKLMQKLHQMYSGTVKFESGNSMVFDYSKAEFIYAKFRRNKIGIFYKFKEELNALKDIYGDDLTTELSVFKDTDKSIALQIVSGREGVSLKEAEFLVYYNIDFSATSYWQSRDRMVTKSRLNNKVYWVFSKGGIEHDIYKAVQKKRDYTISHFKRDVLNQEPKQKKLF